MTEKRGVWYTLNTMPIYLIYMQSNKV
jgi:hypothetical protein